MDGLRRRIAIMCSRHGSRLRIIYHSSPAATWVLLSVQTALMIDLLPSWLHLECENVGLNGLTYSGLGVEMDVRGFTCVRNVTWQSGLWISGPTMLLIVLVGCGAVAPAGDGDAHGE